MERNNSKFRICLIIKNPSYSKRTSGRGIKAKVACRPEFEAICCPNLHCQKDRSFWCQLAVNTSNLVGVDFVGPQVGGFNDPNLGKHTILVFVDEECMHMTELVIGGE